MAHDAEQTVTLWKNIPPKYAFFGGILGGILLLGTLGFILMLSLTLSGAMSLSSDSAENDSASGDSNVLGAADTGQQNTNNAAPSNVPASADNVKKPNNEDHIRGSKDAEISLIEYSDFECPFCQRFHPTAQQLLTAYEGKVNWVYRNFPLSFHPNAQKAAEGGECAAKIGGNDLFWKFADKVFETGKISESELPDVADEVGIQKDAFTTCLQSGEMAARVQQDLTEGQQAGVTGTPGNILLNNKTGKTVLVPGAVPYAQLKSAVDQLLGS